MANLHHHLLTNYYKLGKDIDLSSISNFQPIGDCSLGGTSTSDPDNWFMGDFDGGGYTLSNLTIDTTANKNQFAVGMFGCVGAIPFDDGIEPRIHDLTLEDPVVMASTTGPDDPFSSIPGGERVGALVGWADECWGITNVNIIRGVVSGKNDVGGVVGKAHGTLIETTSFGGTVDAASGNAGGLSGTLLFTSVRDSSAQGAVTGAFAGGIAGYASQGPDDGINEVCRSYAVTTVSGNNITGGVIGQMFTGSTVFGHNSFTSNSTFCGQPDPAVPTGGTVFWSTDMPSGTHGVGQVTGWDSLPSDPGGTQKANTTTMQTPGTYINAGWLQTVWQLNSGEYPSLL
jgi:hypothetical protein